MKMTKTLTIVLPALVFVSGCSMLPGKKAPEELVISASEEVAPQIESTFLEGDTLWGFAERTTGSGFNWERIMELNNIADEKNIDAGVVLLVPPELALESLTAQ